MQAATQRALPSAAHVALDLLQKLEHVLASPRDKRADVIASEVVHPWQSEQVRRSVVPPRVRRELPLAWPAVQPHEAVSKDVLRTERANKHQFRVGKNYD